MVKRNPLQHQVDLIETMHMKDLVHDSETEIDAADRVAIGESAVQNNRLRDNDDAVEIYFKTFAMLFGNVHRHSEMGNNTRIMIMT